MCLKMVTVKAFQGITTAVLLRHSVLFWNSLWDFSFFFFFFNKSWWQIITSGNGHTQHLWYFCLTNCSQVGWSTLKGVVSQYEFVILARTSSLIWPYLRSSILATDTSVPVLLVSTVLTALHGSKQSFICSVEKLKEDNRFALLSRKQSCIIVDATAWTSLL